MSILLETMVNMIYFRWDGGGLLSRRAFFLFKCYGTVKTSLIAFLRFPPGKRRRPTASDKTGETNPIEAILARVDRVGRAGHILSLKTARTHRSNCVSQWSSYLLRIIHRSWAGVKMARIGNRLPRVVWTFWSSSDAPQ